MFKGNYIHLTQIYIDSSSSWIHDTVMEAIYKFYVKMRLTWWNERDKCQQLLWHIWLMDSELSTAKVKQNTESANI